MRNNFNPTKEIETIPISTIKNDIKSNIGKSITIYEINKNTKKSTNTYTGTILNVYNNFFDISMIINNSRIEKSFNYSGFSVGLLRYDITD